MDGRGICRGGSERGEGEEEAKPRDKTRRLLYDEAEEEETVDNETERGSRLVSYGNDEPLVSYIRMTRHEGKGVRQIQEERERERSAEDGCARRKKPDSANRRGR